MNLKLKTLVAAVAMVAAGAAQAAISTDGWNTMSGVGEGTGAGEIFLSIYDPTLNQSLVLDLNLTVSDFRYNNASLINTFSVTDSTLQSFIASSPDQSLMMWNMGGLSNSGYGFDLGMVTTHGSAGATIENFEKPFDGNAMFGGMNNMEWFVGLNSTTTVVGATTAGGHLSNYWRENYGGTFAFDNRHTGFTGGELMSFFYADGSDPEFGPTTAQTFANAEWVVNPTTGSVTYVSAVPIPAAVWLFASGLLGLVGISRRRKQI